MYPHTVQVMPGVFYSRRDETLIIDCERLRQRLAEFNVSMKDRPTVVAVYRMFRNDWPELPLRYVRVKGAY